MEKADDYIQYRANKKYPNRLVKYPNDDIPFNERQSRIRMGYINGAREQKQIDDERLEGRKQELIDKACTWLKKEYYRPYDSHEEREYIDSKINEFRLAMEE